MTKAWQLQHAQNAHIMPRSIAKKENKHLEQHYNKIQKKKEMMKRHVNYAVKLSKQKIIEKDLGPGALR